MEPLGSVQGLQGVWQVWLRGPGVPRFKRAQTDTGRLGFRV